MKKTQKVLIVSIFAIVTGIITIGPAMADKDSAPGQNNIEICHYDKEEKEYEEKRIPKKAAESHERNHVNDIIPAPEEGCPEIKEEISEKEDSLNLEKMMGIFTETTIFENKMSEMQKQIDELKDQGNGNFIFRQVLDTNEEDNGWNPNGVNQNFVIKDDEINSNSVISITIVKPLGNEDLIPDCRDQIIMVSSDSYRLGVDCSARLPDGTILNYMIMNPN